MCVVAIAWQVHPKWQLILAGNRDEFHARPAAPVARWQGTEHVIAGRDLQSGGTWIGVSEQGRLAVVTNLRNFGDPDPARTSRGALLTDYLAGTGAHATLPQARLNDFNPFSLIVAQSGQLRRIANRPGYEDHILKPGIHGLSNTPPVEFWPRREFLAAQMEQWAGQQNAPTGQLFDILAQEALPAAFLQSDPEAAPIFLRADEYGTRCSTVITIDYEGNGVIAERSFAPLGIRTGDVEIAFKWAVTS